MEVLKLCGLGRRKNGERLALVEYTVGPLGRDTVGSTSVVMGNVEVREDARSAGSRIAEEHTFETNFAE